MIVGKKIYINWFFGIFIMPYDNISELPDRIKNVLPSHAEEIYLEAFNHALETYKDESKRRTNDSLEEIAQKVAWSAVKKKYVKNDDGKWVEITSPIVSTTTNSGKSS